MHVCSVMSDSATPWSVACQATLSIGFSRQEYWSGLPLPPPGDLPDPGIKPVSLAHISHALQSDSLHTEPSGKLILNIYLTYITFLYWKLLAVLMVRVEMKIR